MSDSTKDHVLSTFDQIKGKAKEAVGNLTGDKSTDAEGQVDQAKGTVRGGVGDAKDMVNDHKDEASNAFGDAKDKLSDKMGNRA